MQIKPDVLTVLSELEYPSPTSVRIAGQLDRKLYTSVNDVLEALGGKWSRKLKVHEFGSDAQVRIDHAITTGEVETGQDVGFFETPSALARKLVKLAGVKPGHVVLEPSAGNGRIVEALQIIEARVTAFEWDPKRWKHLASRVLTDLDVLEAERDFMAAPCIPRFDRVVMNPPFCKVGIGDHLDHVRHAYGMLRPGGVLVSVLPSSVQFRRDRRYAEFRTWCLDRGTIDALPAGSFKESGTGVNTVVARLAT